jgi:hypothetical protein
MIPSMIALANDVLLLKVLRRMTLTEALDKSIVVRRTSWPWWKCLNNVVKDPKRIWAIEERPRLNG